MALHLQNEHHIKLRNNTQEIRIKRKFGKKLRESIKLYLRTCVLSYFVYTGY